MSFFSAIWIILLGVVIFFVAGPVKGPVYKFNKGNKAGVVIFIIGCILFLIYLIPRIRI